MARAADHFVHSGCECASCRTALGIARERDEARAEVERLREALHRIHRGDPMPHKIAADALTDIPEKEKEPHG